MNRYIRRYLLLGLLILLSSSSFYIRDYLTQQLKQQEVTAQQLNYATTLSIPLALQLKRQQYQQGSASWLQYSIKLAKYRATVALELANFYLKKHSLASSSNNSNTKKALFWYQHAISLGNESAKVKLARYYYDLDDFLKATEIINSISVQNKESSLLSAKVAIATGDINKVVALLPLLAKSPQGKKLVKLISHFSVINDVSKTVKESILPNGLLLNANNNDTVLPTSPIRCENSIQLFATTVENLLYGEKLINQFEQQPKEQSLKQTVCFTPVRYRSIKKLQCKNSLDKRISCDESQWLDSAVQIETKYLAVLLPKGGANVHLGILYIDKYDTVAVFAHEISHLLGFVDEYPLPVNHQNCQQSQPQIFANNIAVLPKAYKGNRRAIRKKILSQLAWSKFIKDSTPILHLKSSANNLLINSQPLANTAQWQLGTPINYDQEIGLFFSESCDKTPLQAFKPLKRQTQLRYFEKPLPRLYPKILALQGNKYNMPSFHYNIAMALLAKNQNKKVQSLLRQAASFEKITHKKEQILTANF